ncbi:MAG: outer membrane beta-barrel protein [Prevotella sp.]
MKKKLYLVVMAMMLALAAHAQFEKDKIYVGASMSGLGISYNGSEKTNFGLDAKGGYMIMDNVMLTGSLGYHKMEDVPSVVSLGVGGRYYIEQNGIYLGASLNYSHINESCDDFQPSVQIGYAFFLSRTVTIEPEIYYNQSFKSHKDYSKVGLRIGVGVYL